MSLKKLIKKNLFLSAFIRDVRDYVYRKMYDDTQFKIKFYKKTHGREPNLKNPQSYTEKMLWSSINYRDKRFVDYADKFLVRNHVKELIGEEFLIPIYDVVEDVDQLKFDNYPDKFVLNATHGSNMVMLCDKKNNFNVRNARSAVNIWLHTNYYHRFREWNYNYIKPRVVVLKNLCDEKGVPPVDYKFFCFSGKPVVVALDIDRFGDETKRNVYDMNWKRLDSVKITRPQDTSKKYNKPDNFELMINLAEKLSDGFEHVRVDFYNVNGKIYFGELTFLHSAAGLTGNITPWAFDVEMGSYYHLPQRNIDSWSFL